MNDEGDSFHPKAAALCRERLTSYVPSDLMADSPLIVLRASFDPTAELRTTRTRSGRQLYDAPVTSIWMATERVSDEGRRDLERDPEVVATAQPMPTTLIRPLAEGSPTGAPPWGLDAIGALNSPFDGSGVRCAILDTGIDAAHPAFAGHGTHGIVEKDFTGEGNGDSNGHGTHCAGTLFGGDVAGTRIGVAPRCARPLVGKVLRGDGSGDTSFVVDGFLWAASQGAHIVSLSLGIDFPGLVRHLTSTAGIPVDVATSIALTNFRETIQLFDTLKRFLGARPGSGGGPLVVAASGNESRRDQGSRYRIAAGPPSCSAGTIAVGALGRVGNALEVAPFSNDRVALAGPGVGVSSARAGGKDLVSFDGTSMATPHVAGAAALWCQKLLAESGVVDFARLERSLLSSCVSERLRTPYLRSDVGEGLVTCPQ